MKKTIFHEKVLRQVKYQSKPVVVSLHNVSKKYLIHHEKPTFVETVEKKLRREVDQEFWALKDVNLLVHQGEKVGFYGPNGAGKTTLLKLISGIAYPTQGKVTTKGKVISLIDLEAGFHPDLSGQENIFLNGSLIGMTTKEIEDHFRAIVDFSGLGNFITAPLYTYSTGMKLRLGFSIAIHASPDVLILDEMIMVGDKEFNAKVQKIITQYFKDDKKTLVVVSHFYDYLKDNCTRLIEIEANANR